MKLLIFTSFAALLFTSCDRPSKSTETSPDDRQKLARLQAELDQLKAKSNLPKESSLKGRWARQAGPREECIVDIEFISDADAIVNLRELQNFGFQDGRKVGGRGEDRKYPVTYAVVGGDRLKFTLVFGITQLYRFAVKGTTLVLTDTEGTVREYRKQ